LIPEGQKFAKKHWRIVNALTEKIAHQCSCKLINIAKAYNCQSIVFEHLGRLRMPKNFRGANRLRKKLTATTQGRGTGLESFKALLETLRLLCQTKVLIQ